MNANAAISNERSRLPWPMQLAVPVASVITFGTHLLIAQNAPPLETRSYMLLFWEIIGVSIVLAIAQKFWPALRKWMRHMDIGTDNGLPVVPKLEYAKILPKYFRGTIEKVEFDLGPAKLSAEDLQRIYLQRLARAVRN